MRLKFFIWLFLIWWKISRITKYLIFRIILDISITNSIYWINIIYLWSVIFIDKSLKLIEFKDFKINFRCFINRIDITFISLFWSVWIKYFSIFFRNPFIIMITDIRHILSILIIFIKNRIYFSRSRSGRICTEFVCAIYNINCIN